MNKKRILIIDKNSDSANDLQNILDHNGYYTCFAESDSEAFNLLESNNFDLIFLDNCSAARTGIEILRDLLQIKPSAIVIMTSKNGAIQEAVNAAQFGAYNWVKKPYNKENILLTVCNAFEKKYLVSDSKILMSEIRKKYSMVGSSETIRRVCSLISKVALQDTTILITGESGTGKEIAAHAVHSHSRRSTKHFIRINCAAVPDSLLESELFGHKKGAFTGAYSDNRGKFQLADGGSLFFDEIGDLSVNAQAKILRTIETGEVEMIGNGNVEKVDVRLISATNKNLETLISMGKFREDLFHRINVMEINIPPLRERPEDILPLVNYFLEIFCSQKDIVKKKLTPSSEAVLLAYNWPGNVRELKNVIEKITILVDSHIVNGHHVADIIKFPHSINDLYVSNDFRKAKKNFEKIYLSQALWENDWNITQTASVLDLPRSCLYKKIREYSIERSLEKRTINFY